MNGLVLLPSYQRPELLKEFFKAYKETESQVPGLVLVDRKDPKLVNYAGLELPPGWVLELTQSRKMGDKFREVWDKYKDLDFVIILNDDYRPRTKQWDQIVISQIKGHNFVSTNDGMRAPQKMCGAIAISGKIYRELGYLFPEGLQHLYSDDFFEMIGTQTGCWQCLMDVMVEHDHVFKHQQKDQTHEEVYSKESWDADGLAYKTWTETRAAQDIQKIRDLQPKTGIMICTPSHDGNCALAYALGLADTCANLIRHNIYFEMARVVGSSLIPHARNSLVDMFLKSKCQKLMFIDADQGWEASHIFALLNSSRRIIAGVTPHKRFPINLNFEPLEADKHYFKDLVNKGVEEYVKFINEKSDKVGEIEVNRSGTGFMMIDRSVFDFMKDQVDEYYPFDGNKTVKHREFFKMGAFDGTYHGEDWAFTTLAKKLNIPIYIQSRTLVSHYGHHNFSVTG